MKYHSTYKKILIFKTGIAGSALPWQAHIKGKFCAADTLAGIKKLINERITK